MRIKLPFSALLVLVLSSAAAATHSSGTSFRAEKPNATSNSVTFFITSDCHYDAFENEDRNQRVHDTVLEMNKMTAHTWPAKLGGGAIQEPRGVLVLGDVIDDGDRLLQGRHQTPVQYEAFEKDFGLDGTDGVLRFPVFEGWGNHDGPPVGKDKHGFSFQAHLKARNRVRMRKGLISNLSQNGLHYSWDWGGIHFVQLNIYPADRQNPRVRYSPVWHDPQNALSFLVEDLSDGVGTSGRPVVLLSHCGFDSDWWIPEDWKAVYSAVKAYRVILYAYGHSGTGVRQWAPEGETKKWLCVNTGQTEKGFFVVSVHNDQIRLAYRVKNLKVSREPGQPHRFEWDGSWSWKHVQKANVPHWKDRP